MKYQDLLYILPQYLLLAPAAVSCYLPMKHQIRYGPAKTAVLCLAALVPFSLAAAGAQLLWELQTNLLLFPALILFFPLYRMTIKTNLSRSLAVYVGVCAIETFPSQLAAALDARLHPELWFVGLSVEAALLQAALSLLLLASAWTIRRRLVWIVDHLDFPKVWYSTVLLSGVFLVFNAIVVPNFPELYQAGQSYHLFPVLQVCALALLICIYVLFYQSARLMWERAQLEQRTQLLEMQSHQYRTLQEHMEQTARLRHDFRHSVRLLSDMARQGNLDGVQTHLAQYESVLTESAAVNYCSNAALNALFRHYHETAVLAEIKTVWKLEIPNPLTVSELDLASLFGNILENGIEGCQTVPTEKRYFNLTTEIRQGNSLYVVATNSFDGHIKKGKNGYRSTKHGGAGIGLAAIAAVAEKYDGVFRVSNSDSEFFTDVVIKI